MAHGPVSQGVLGASCGQEDSRGKGGDAKREPVSPAHRTAEAAKQLLPKDAKAMECHTGNDDSEEDEKK